MLPEEVVVPDSGLRRGLKFVSKFREERLEAIAHELSNMDHDIVALQEIWVFADYLKVQERIAKRLPHSKFFYG